MKKVCLIFFAAVLGMFLLIASASALILDVGSPLLMIDGTGADTTVTLANLNITSGYGLGYYLNYGSSFYDLGTSLVSITLALNGGDVVDFALYDDLANDGYTPGDDTLYTLSGDLTDTNYSVIMDFSGEISAAQAEQPAPAELLNMGIDVYWQDVNINWFISNNGSTAAGFTVSASTDPADGMTPVPEPGTLMLLGAGLMGAAFYARRRKI